MAGDLINGNIPDHWEFTTLGDICQRGGGNIQTGPFGSQLHASDYVPAGIPSIMPTNIGDNRIVEDGIVRITEEDANRLGQHRLKAGDIVYSRRGDVEKRALIREREKGWLCGTGCLKVRLGSGVVDPLFASLFLGHPAIREWIVRHAVGATMPNLNTSIMSAVPFALPPLAEQKAIARILGTLDDKIELNRQMNATLEAMARALFRSWFVDFDPVRAKLDGRKPAGMDAATAALFPDTFQDSELGHVPSGWKVERFDAHITADRGLSYKGDGLRDDATGLPMHNLNSIYEGGGYKHEGIKYYEGEHREKHLVEPGDMIVTNTEQGFDHMLIGHAAIVPRCFGSKGLFSHHIYRVRFKQSSPFNSHYLVELFNNPRWHYWISGFSNGTTINMLPKDALEMPLLVVPPIELVKKFTELVQATHDQIEDNIHQSRTLAVLRDTLLPKLLSGELSLKEAATKI